MAEPDAEPVRRALIMGVVLVVVLAGMSGWLGVRAYQDRQSDRTRDVLLTAARQCAANLTTIDNTRVESDVRRVLDCATGGFRDDFAARSEAFIDVVKRTRSTSAGTVTEAGLESVNGTRGLALVSGTAGWSRGSTRSEPQRPCGVKLIGLRVTLIRGPSWVAGTWP